MRLTAAQYAARFRESAIAEQCDALGRMLADRRARVVVAPSVTPDETLGAIVAGLQGFEPRPLAPLAVRRAVVEVE